MSFVTPMLGLIGVTLIACVATTPGDQILAAAIGGAFTVAGFLGWPE